MPHKDPEASKAYWLAYRSSPLNKEKQRRWKEKRHALMQNEEWRDQYYDNNLRRRYGITIETYKSMFAAQNGCCAICKKHQDHEKRRLSVDHCHSTGAVRGLLCQHCNHALGKFGDAPALLRAAADYLEVERQPPETPPTRVWGKATKRLRQPGGSEAEGAA